MKKRTTSGKRPSAKARTFAQAHTDIFSLLRAEGWTVKSDLRIPHATSPDGQYRLWFKPQAVYFCFASQGRHDFANARSMWVEDIRKMSPLEFLVDATKNRVYYEKNR